jgi:alpha-mannosidase
MRDLDGAPRLQLGTSDEFFDRVEAELAAGAEVPVWRGELYFEMHRGTLTSQIETKVGNRGASGCCARPSCGGPPVGCCRTTSPPS